MIALVGDLASWLDRSLERNNIPFRGEPSRIAQDISLEESSGAPTARELLGYFVTVLPPF